MILASTYTVAWAGNTQNETPHHHAIESITQVKTVTGVVTDQYGPVIGANVHVKGSTTGTITDIDGKFSIEVPVNSVLEISYIGFSYRGNSNYRNNQKSEYPSERRLRDLGRSSGSGLWYSKK